MKQPKPWIDYTPIVWFDVPAECDSSTDIKEFLAAVWFAKEETLNIERQEIEGGK